MDTLVLISVALINLLLGAFVLFKDSKNKINLSFSIVAFGIAIWVAAWAIDFWVSDVDSKLFWARMMLAGPSIIPTAFLYFAFVFPKAEVKISRMLLVLFFIAPSLLLLAFVPTSYYVQDIKIAPWGIDFTPGPGYLPNMIVSVAYFGLAFIIIANKFFRFRGMDKVKVGYLFLGTFIAAFLGVLVNYVLPLLGVTRFNKYGPMATIAMVGFTSYAIVKHHLMDISVIISRVVAEVLTIVFLGTVYLGLVWLHLTYVSPRIDWLFLTWTILYGIIVGQVYQRVRLFIQTTSDKVFLRGKYDYYKELSEVSLQVGEKLSLSSILSILYRVFYEVVEISNPRIFLPIYFNEPGRTSDRYVPYDRKTFVVNKTGEDIKFNDPLVEQLISTRAPIVNPQDPNRELIVPCLLENRLIAIFVLGRKLSEDPYTDEDIRLLEVLASQAAIALDHTRSYEKIKVDLEIAEGQLARSQRLASLGTLTAGITHEIRNPLTVIRSETERLAAQVRDLEYLRNYRNLVLKHVDRIAGIIERMLSMAKEKRRQEIKVNLNEIINSTLQLITISRISLKKELNEVPPVTGDPMGLEEVFVNLINNAIEAMPEGGTLTLRTYVENDRVVAEVSDTGKGIPEEIREKIFDPFYSTRHEGVGLGLSIVYRIVREHGGDIKVTSEVGRGTTFKISFPA